MPIVLTFTKKKVISYLCDVGGGAWPIFNLAEVTLESSLRPPWLRCSQFFVLEYVRTSSGKTGMELTNEIEGKKGVNCLLFSDSFGSSSSLSDGLK